MWSKMTKLAVKFLAVFLTCSPVLAEPYIYPAPTPWHSYSDNTIQDATFTIQPQQGYQYAKPSTQPAQGYQYAKPLQPQQGYQYTKPSNNVVLRRKVYQIVIPYQNSPGFIYQQKPVTYQQVNKKQKNPRFLQQDSRYQFNEFGDETGGNQQRRGFTNSGQKRKPFTSYDAPIHHNPDQENHLQQNQAQSDHSTSEYQNFLNDIAHQNGVNFQLQGNGQKPNQRPNFVQATDQKPIYENQEESQGPNNGAVFDLPALVQNQNFYGQVQNQHQIPESGSFESSSETLDPQILKIIQDLLFKEETRINDKELKKKLSAGGPLTSYGIPINHKQVIGVELGPAIRAISLAHLSI